MAANNITLPSQEKDLENGSSDNLAADHEVNVGRPLRGGHRPVSVMLSPDQFKAFERMCAYLSPELQRLSLPRRPHPG
jgi:hypothetical protein